MTRQGVDDPADPQVPAGTRFWDPITRDELDLIDAGEEPQTLSPPLDGLHDTWLVGHLERQDLERELMAERELFEAIDQVTGSQDEFDRVADAVMFQDLDEPQLTPAQLAIVVANDPLALDAALEFDIGVCSLVQAINVLGMQTRASCRGHAHRWSEHPVVYFAATEAGVARLSPLLAKATGEYVLHPAHPDLLAIELPSVEQALRLAGLILESQ